MLYEHLQKNYKQVEPIFLEDIMREGVSRDRLRSKLNYLVDKGLLRRFERDVYYLPKLNFIGEEEMRSDEVIIGKYLGRKGNIFGYYSGYTLAFRMGINKRHSETIEIVSNNMTSNKKFKSGDHTQFLIRKPRIRVDDNNYKILQLLDLLKDIDIIAEDINYAEIVLKDYIRENDIKRDIVDKYIEVYPIKVYKNIYKMRLGEVLM